jgi:hypothetical protein
MKYTYIYISTHLSSNGRGKDGAPVYGTDHRYWESLNPFDDDDVYLIWGCVDSVVLRRLHAIKQFKTKPLLLKIVASSPFNISVN